MNHESKLTLSDEELQLVNDTGWILTKHTIIGKVYAMFGALAEMFKAAVENQNGLLAEEVIQSSAKISKGENYRQLPYVMLDYPRCFNAENTFTIRTMFWWGNFFSITLQLSGNHKKLFEKKIVDSIALLKEEEFFICIGEDRWQHHFEQDNYCAVNKLGNEKFRETLFDKEFIKLSVKFPLQQWNEMQSMLEKSFSTILSILTSEPVK